MFWVQKALSIWNIIEISYQFNWLLNIFDQNAPFTQNLSFQSFKLTAEEEKSLWISNPFTQNGQWWLWWFITMAWDCCNSSKNSGILSRHRFLDFRLCRKHEVHKLYCRSKWLQAFNQNKCAFPYEITCHALGMSVTIQMNGITMQFQLHQYKLDLLFRLYLFANRALHQTTVVFMPSRKNIALGALCLGRKRPAIEW